jgi:uncharacterized protein YukE
VSLDIASAALGELERLLSQYDERLRGVEDVWRAFVDSALKIKSSWDADVSKVRACVSQVKGVIESLSRELELLLAKRELGLILEREHNELSAELQKRQSEYSERLHALLQKLEDVESRVIYLWARALTREYLSRLDLVQLEKRAEDSKAAERIDEETYAKIKREIAIMKQVWELLGLLPAPSKA